MDRRRFNQLTCAAGLAAVGKVSDGAGPSKPNLVIIHTDEHNFRTLGCYRDQLPKDQAFVWGEGVKVDTPHIDSLARDGALCTSYYAASPVCTPSRASLISGLYPIATGSPNNDMPLNDDLVSFAEILRRNGYATSYVGKWHLDGQAKPGWAPKRKFGFEDNRYMFNRGHWKLLEDTADGPRVKARDAKDRPTYDIDGADTSSFTTDFLTDRVLEIIERDKGKPFCVLLSIPDPHGPNSVRAPYDTMYTDLVFKTPLTMDADAATMPRWVNLGGNNSAAKLNQHQMAQYFGMVRCIDDNVGRIMAALREKGLDDDTIVVFTSDHGDLMGEHKKHNKGLPYETSAGIPFVIRYPRRIPAGKVIHTAQTNVDFAPTMLAMMGFGGQLPGCHGEDTSADFLGQGKEVKDERIVYFTHAGSQWVAAVTHRYKLIVSPKDHPWLFDLEEDPDELVNQFDKPQYKAVADKLMKELKLQMTRFGEPALERVKLICDSDALLPVDAPAKPARGSLSGNVLRPGDEDVTGYLVDARDIVRDVPGGSWTRALTVPPGSFAPDTTYELIIDWESKGLGKGADFYANFLCDGPGGRKKQLSTWEGAEGEAGTLTTELKTDSSDKWTLAVGVRGKGHLVVKRIRIKTK